MSKPELTKEESALVHLSKQLVGAIYDEDRTTKRFSTIMNTAFAIYRKSLEMEPDLFDRNTAEEAWRPLDGETLE